MVSVATTPQVSSRTTGPQAARRLPSGVPWSCSESAYAIASPESQEPFHFARPAER